jgi:hypothetical protein
MNGRPNRIQKFRETILKPDEKKLVDDVEKYGCHILQVRPQQPIPGWSYTIGLYENLQQPELIVVGLKPDLAASVLNAAAQLMKEGARFREGQRASNLIANVDCEFREAEQHWARHIMGYALWFYRQDQFPVLQCIYPDLNNRFPWEDGFEKTWRSRQPLFFSGAQSTSVERDFWAANDPSSSLFSWKFSDPPHTGVFTTKRVMSDTDPVTRVFHTVGDGAWEFHGPDESDPEEIAYVCFHHIVDKDPTIAELADLPVGWCAWKDVATGEWRRAASEKQS